MLTFNIGLAKIVCEEMHKDLTVLSDELQQLQPLSSEFVNNLEKLKQIARSAQLRSIQKVLTILVASAVKLNIDNDNYSLLDATRKMVHSLRTHLSEIIVKNTCKPMSMTRQLMVLSAQLKQDNNQLLGAELFMPFTPEYCYFIKNKCASSNSEPNLFKDNDYNQDIVISTDYNDVLQYEKLRQIILNTAAKHTNIKYCIFFETAIAVLDILKNNKSLDLDKLSKMIAHKIANEINEIKQDTTQLNDDLLSTMLNVVANADPDTSERVKKLQLNLDLKSYLPGPAVDPVIADKFLQALYKLKEMWQHYNKTTEKSYIVQLINELKLKSSTLNNSGFALIINTLDDIIFGINSGQFNINNDRLLLEVASTILALEQQLQLGSNMNTAHASVMNLYNLVGEKNSFEVTHNPRTIDNTTLNNIALQVLNDLHNLEPHVIAYLNKNTDSETMLINGLLKIRKVLGIFGKENSLIEAFSMFEKKLLSTFTTVENSEIIEHFTKLGYLVEWLNISEQNAMNEAQHWIKSMHTSEYKDDEKDTPNDTVMLEIFLEETTNIVTELEKNLAQLRKDHSDHEPLINLRRLFHTLKGSGRMVGLIRLGDLSYIGERLLNNHIKNKNIPSMAFLDYYKKLIENIKTHMSNLRTKGYTHIKYAELEALELELEETPTEEVLNKKYDHIKLIDVKPSKITSPMSDNHTDPGSVFESLNITTEGESLVPELPFSNSENKYVAHINTHNIDIYKSPEMIQIIPPQKTTEFKIENTNNPVLKKTTTATKTVKPTKQLNSIKLEKEPEKKDFFSWLQNLIRFRK